MSTMSRKPNNQFRPTVEEFEPRVVLSRFSHFVHHVEHEVAKVGTRIGNEIRRDIEKVEHNLASFRNQVEAAAKKGLAEVNRVVSRLAGFSIRPAGDNYNEVRQQF